MCIRDRSLALLKLLTDTRPDLAPYLYVFSIPSADRPSLEVLAGLADGIVTWGGDEAVRAARSMAPAGCKLIEWSHRLSFAYASGRPPEEEWYALARHIPVSYTHRGRDARFLPHHDILRYLAQGLGRLHVEAVASGQVRQGDDARRLPVVEKGKLVGVISLADLARSHRFDMEAAQALCLSLIHI